MGYQVFRIKRNFKSLALLVPNFQVTRTHWLPTSFIATRNPERIILVFKEPGWQVLKQKND